MSWTLASFKGNFAGHIFILPGKYASFFHYEQHPKTWERPWREMYL